MRISKPYNPQKDAARRWPDWRIVLTNLHGIGEIVDPNLRLILIDPARVGRAWAKAHALSHLDLAHVETGCSEFSEGQEEDADWLAGVRLYYTRPRLLRRNHGPRT